MKHYEKVKQYLERNGCEVLLEDTRADSVVIRLTQSRGVIVTGLEAYAVHWMDGGYWCDDRMTISPVRRKFSDVLADLGKIGYKFNKKESTDV